jgi:hypothetical protein
MFYAIFYYVCVHLPQVHMAGCWVPMEVSVPSNEQSTLEQETLREWLSAMDRAEEHGSRFPAIDLSNGSPAEEFAKDRKGYWKRAKAIARELATFGGITVFRGRRLRAISPKP